MNKKEVLLKSIEELHEKDRNASLSGDIETLVSLFTEDGILIPEEGDIIKGRNNLKKMLEQSQNEVKEYDLVEYKHDFREVKTMDNFAYEWGYYSGRYISKKNRTEIKESGKLMRILELQNDGSWKISRAIWTVDK